MLEGHPGCAFGVANFWWPYHNARCIWCSHDSLSSWNHVAPSRLLYFLLTVSQLSASGCWVENINDLQCTEPETWKGKKEKKNPKLFFNIKWHIRPDLWIFFLMLWKHWCYDGTKFLPCPLTVAQATFAVMVLWSGNKLIKGLMLNRTTRLVFPAHKAKL